MNDLTRVLEYLATADKGQVDVVKYSRTSWLVRLNDLDDQHATGVGNSLEQAARCCLESALCCGLLCEPMPRTEPNPEVGDGR